MHTSFLGSASSSAVFQDCVTLISSILGISLAGDAFGIPWGYNRNGSGMPLSFLWDVLGRSWVGL